MNDTKTAISIFYKPFLLIYLSIGFVWARSFYEKLMSGKFVDTIGFALVKFASKNPYPFYKAYLEKVVIPNAKAYGYVTLWGEFLTATAILGGVLYFFIKPGENKLIEIILLAGLVGGIFLNGNFWFASGWMSPAGDNLNILMFVLELIGSIAVLLQVIK